MSVINIEIKNIKQIRQAFGLAPALMTKNLSTAIKQTIFFVRAKAVSNAPVRTSNLRGSVYQSFGPLKGEIGFNAKYAGWVHDGTSPYTIRPKTKKALYWKGASHPMRLVRHPGIKANPYLQRAVDDSQEQIDKFFVKAVQNALNVIGKKAG